MPQSQNQNAAMMKIQAKLFADRRVGLNDLEKQIEIYGTPVFRNGRVSHIFTGIRGVHRSFPDLNDFFGTDGLGVWRFDATGLFSPTGTTNIATVRRYLAGRPPEGDEYPQGSTPVDAENGRDDFEIQVVGETPNDPPIWVNLMTGEPAPHIGMVDGVVGMSDIG